MKLFKENLVKKIAKKHGVDPRVTRLIIDYPIKFFKEIAADDTNPRPVRIRYFGVFTPKKEYLDKINEEVSNIENSVITNNLDEA